MCPSFVWVIPLLFLGVFIYFLFSSHVGPPFWHHPGKRKKNWQQKDLYYENQELKEEISDLQDELNYLRKKVRELEKSKDKR